MTPNFTRPSLLLMVSLAMISCNQNNKRPTKVGSPVDTIYERDAPEIKDTTAENPDVTKRNINLSQAQWAAFKKRYSVVCNIEADNSITGSFIGDDSHQTLYLVAPVEDTSKDKFQECIGGCNSYIVSPDTSLTILKVNNNLGGEIKNIGDIDGDGGDDIMVYPSWWQSNWNAYIIYSYNKNLQKWCYLIEPVSIFANELEKKITFVKKSLKKGYISAYTSESTDTDIKSSYKDYKILK